jgi:uncharacterized membrane protein (UPF0127 family)
MKWLIEWIKTNLIRQNLATPAAKTDGPYLQAVNMSNGEVIARRILWAGTSETRRCGLLRRDTLDPDEGMYIVPTQWIHMFGMRFPIDVAFIASNGRVLHLHHGIRPNRLSRLVLRAEGALELAEGVLRKSKTAVGDIIKFEESLD